MLEASVNTVAQSLPGVPVDESHQTYIAENQGTDQLPPGATVGASVAAINTSLAATEGTASPELGELDSDEAAASRPAKSSDAVVQVLQDMFSFFGRNKSQPTAAAQRKSSGSYSAASRRRRKDPPRSKTSTETMNRDIGGPLHP